MAEEMTQPEPVWKRVAEFDDRIVTRWADLVRPCVGKWNKGAKGRRCFVTHALSFALVVPATLLAELRHRGMDLPEDLPEDCRQIAVAGVVQEDSECLRNSASGLGLPDLLLPCALILAETDGVGNRQQLRLKLVIRSPQSFTQLKPPTKLGESEDNLSGRSDWFKKREGN